MPRENPECGQLGPPCGWICFSIFALPFLVKMLGGGKGRFYLTPFLWTLLFLWILWWSLAPAAQLLVLGPPKLNQPCWGADTEPTQPLHVCWNFRLFGLLLTGTLPSTHCSVKKWRERGLCVLLESRMSLVFDVHWVALWSYFCFCFSLQPSSTPGSENVMPREPLVRTQDTGVSFSNS